MPTAAEAGRDRLVVLDASSAVGVLLDPDAPERPLLARASLLAPTLLPFEVANVLRRLREAGRLEAPDARRALDDLALLGIEPWPWDVLADRVWELGGNLSSYDAAYVALAERTGATLVTRDARLARAPGIRCRVEVV